MSNPCLASTCLNGNCVGCRGGTIWCDDPRCFPNCANCPNTSTSTNNHSWMVTIILVLLAVLLVISFIIGYSWYKDRQRASEPKRVTVNKHLHTVVPPAIVVSSPPPIAPVVASVVPSVVPSVPIVSSVNCGANLNPQPTTETLSYSGMKFSLN